MKRLVAAIPIAAALAAVAVGGVRGAGSPAWQDGYNVTFQPFAGAQAPRTPNQATYRADGLAQAPDGTLYIAESVKGRVWRVIYTGAAK